MIVLTSEGAQLLRKAVNDSKKIVFTRAKDGSRYDMDSRGDLAAKPPTWFDGQTGSISAVSNALGFLQVIASWDAVDSGVLPIKSACIMAQEAKDGVSPTYATADDVIFAIWCDDNAGYVNGSAIRLTFELPICLGSGLIDAVGTIPTQAGLTFVSFAAGEAPADGVLQVKLSNGTVLDIAANEHSEG